MSSDKPLKLNFNGEKVGVISLSESESYVLRNSGLKINSYLDVESLNLPLDSHYTYKITGGSDIAGAPARKYVNCYFPIREKILKRKKSLRVLGHLINPLWSVLNVKVSKKSEDLKSI